MSGSQSRQYVDLTSWQINPKVNVMRYHWNTL
jgi:hypothetical protein